MYSCGRNDNGQLGHGDVVDKKIPTLISLDLIKENNVIDINSNSTHTINDSNTGDNSNGNIDSDNVSNNKNNDDHNEFNDDCNELNTKKIIGISCGQLHTLILLNNGISYACGSNEYGQLCIKNIKSISTFTKTLGSNDSIKIKQICCGYFHTLLLSQDGLVTGYGRNDYGQLGIDVLAYFNVYIFSCVFI